MAVLDPTKVSAERGLLETDVDVDPIKQFQKWLDQAQASPIHEPLAMSLASSTPAGKPSVRIVLLRGVDERGFTFYTNYESRKSRELELDPSAALAFYWAELDRQVRIEGRVERVSADESDAYFRTRPRGSQIGAWASPQSQVISGREELERSEREAAAKYEGKDVPRPPHWGGFRVVPSMIEFWEGKLNRLHDRLLYRLNAGGSWSLERLAP
jgi:pyridoxamine 5'-phosphate oxidase